MLQYDRSSLLSVDPADFSSGFDERCQVCLPQLTASQTSVAELSLKYRTQGPVGCGIAMFLRGPDRSPPRRSFLTSVSVFPVPSDLSEICTSFADAART